MFAVVGDDYALCDMTLCDEHDVLPYAMCRVFVPGHAWTNGVILSAVGNKQISLMGRSLTSIFRGCSSGVECIRY